MIIYNFNENEFTCKCGCNRNEIQYRLIVALQKLRNNIKKPIKVSSGYRCPEHNKAIGGVPTSQHCNGLAVDLICEGLDFESFKKHVLLVGDFTAVGLYKSKNFIHCDIRSLGSRIIWEK